RFTQANGLVGERYVRRVPIRVRIHGNRRDPEPPTGSENAARDLTAVRDQDFSEHAHSGRAVPSFTRSGRIASCPHAASTSSPRRVRTKQLNPSPVSVLWKRATASLEGASKSVPSTRFIGMRLILTGIRDKRR